MITSTSAVNDDIFFIFGKIEMMVVMLIARVLLTRRGLCNKWPQGVFIEALMRYFGTAPSYWGEGV